MALLKHSNLSYMLRDHKKKMLSSRDKILLGCDAEANAAAEVVDLSEIDEHDIWENGFDLQEHDHRHHQHEDEHCYYSSGLAAAASSTKASPQSILSATDQFQGRSSGKSLRRQQSAPMNVPDWSKILGSSANASRRHRSSFDDDSDDSDEEMEDRRGGGDLRRLPPHEVVARDYARSHSVAFSVHEGAGHTLKGRDLSRVRNAVLKQTGFL